MNSIKIFDPAMCCSTGICGSGVDPELVRIATILDDLKKEGFEVERFGLAQNPKAFIKNQTINSLIQKEGVNVLPIVLVNGNVRIKRAYPSNDELIEWCKVSIEEENYNK